MGERTRAGRPWTAARGPSAEINELVETLRSWLDVAQMPVARLHQFLTAEHFVSGQVPSLTRLRKQLAGEGLSWDLVEAVADVCHPDDDNEAAGRRLAPLRKLWHLAQTAPTATDGSGPQVTAREVLEVQRQAITAYEELNRARRAFETSEQGRQQALQIATILFGMLGQAQAKVLELTRRIDALRSAPQSPAGIDRLEQTRRRAESQERELRTQLARADSDRQQAQAVANHAARRIQELEAELEVLKAKTENAPRPPDEALPAVSLPPAPDETGLDAVDDTLEKVRAALDLEQEAVQEAAEDLGIGIAPAAGADHGSRTIPGQALTDALPRSALATESQTQASGPLLPTTAHNPLTPPFAPDGPGRDPAPSPNRMRLASAAETIAAGTSIEEVSAALGRAAVPDFADHVVLYLRDPLEDYDTLTFGAIRLARQHVGGQTAHPPPAVPEALAVPRGGPLAEVLGSVRTVAVGDPLSRAALADIDASLAGSRAHAIIAPLHSRRMLLGCAILLRYGPTPYDESDQLVAAQMATHTVLGIDQVLLAQRQATAIMELQRTMLPDSLAQPTGIRLAFRYLPATETARVGGDWYDSISLPGSRAALVIGDVMGHARVSAAIMGQLRTSVQTLSGLDLPPHEVLHHLDEQAQRLGPSHLATCLYAVYDPVSQRLAAANAGHPPPILLHPDGRAEVLQVPAGAPIGVGGVDYETIEVDAPVGAMLLMYTDGLVETRERDVWSGIEQAREQAAAGQRAKSGDVFDLESFCDDVMTPLLGTAERWREDDVALLAARFDGIAPDDVAHWPLEATDRAPREARTLTRDALSRWRLEEMTEAAELLVSELVTNAARHTSQRLTLRLLRTDVLRCEVLDDEPSLPRARRPESLDEAGRGLYLVNRIARRWGVSRLSTGKVVWFELAIPDHRRPQDLAADPGPRP
ncbi:SpoIIE family protein phosphatase [Streptomyces coelicoflavus]|nr:SpoIIE family protein phosphatase [Streptomyces coelicoflavus]MDI6521422.1 SpoIIE family protein phosphatase [Streptomyces coelicoflavus]